MKDIIKSNDLMPHFEAYGMAQIDVTFVEELIFGVPGGLGRTDKKKWFLFEVRGRGIESLECPNDRAFPVGRLNLSSSTSTT